MPDRILITGAAGVVGGVLRPRLARPDRTLCLLDVVDVPELPDAGPDEEVVAASVTDLDAEAWAHEVGDRVDPSTDTLVGGAFTGPDFDGGAHRG